MKERSREPFSPSAARESGANSCHEIWHSAWRWGSNEYADQFGRAVYPVGFVINPSLPHLGCSPDRRVYDPSKIDPWGLLEIKCSPSDYLSDLNYLKHNGRTGAYSLKKTHAYYYQTMGCIGLTASAWEDFFVFCRSEFHCERIYFDPTFFSEMLEKLNHFYFDIHLNASVQWMYTFVGH